VEAGFEESKNLGVDVESASFCKRLFPENRRRTGRLALLQVSDGEERWVVVLVRRSLRGVDAFVQPPSAFTPNSRQNLVSLLDVLEGSGTTSVYLCLERGDPNVTTLCRGFSYIGFSPVSPTLAGLNNVETGDFMLMGMELDGGVDNSSSIGC
jgi:hypothetical protein